MGDNEIKYGRFIHFICTGAVSIRLTAFPLSVKNNDSFLNGTVTRDFWDLFWLE